MSDLFKMMERQYALQLDSFGTDPAMLARDDPDAFAVWAGQMLFGLSDEVHEAAEHCAWKSHATSRHFDRQRFGEELIDVLHYTLALFLAAGWTADDIYRAFMDKADVLARRQAEGHDGVRS